MSFIADILLIAAAMGATFYCFVLSRRLARFNDLEKGVGGAVAVMSAQVDDMTRTLERAREAAIGSTGSLESLTKQAEAVAARLELLVAAMHDLPDAEPGLGAKGEPAQAARPADRGTGVEVSKSEECPENADGGKDPGASGTLFLRHRDRIPEAAE